MIDFQELQLEVNEAYSFVGIERRKFQIIFSLPKGFDPSLFTTYDSKRDLFFQFYRILNHFKEICLQKDYLKADIKTQDRDGVIRNLGSIQRISLPDVEIEENIFYSKLDLIGSILNAYDELKILSLADRLGKSEKIDYSKLHSFLHRAVYLDNGAAYIDAMTLPRQMIHYQSTDIVGMYCYILVEVKQQLHEEISGEVTALAERFKHKYIDAESGLFHDEYSSQTVDRLKDALELIDRNTALKDTDYWYFYDAIELFLHGEISQADEGEIWGIKNFYSVWESMCLTYLAKTVSPEYILHLDTRFLYTNVVSLANSNTKILDLANVFSLNGRRLVPDAVIFSTGFNEFRHEEKNTYCLKLTKKRWDDLTYKTKLNCALPDDSEVGLKIAYEGQPPYNHTFEELEKVYNTQNNQLIINFQLPSNFYSFWEIDLKRLDSKLLDMMFRLNHIFYVALNKAIFTPNQFEKFLLDEFGLNEDLDEFCLDEDNVFNNSLFRRGTIILRLQKIIDEFTSFCGTVCSLKVIDIKYLSLAYCRDIDIKNRRDLKEKSIRKQFVYEYLLQQFIGGNDGFKDLEIKSEFWIPSYQNDSEIIKEVEPEYLDGYISLKNINFGAIANSYLD
ncbi:MAG: hypothetical protein RIB93_09645 [Coleofasciculus sp. D1-CHI-01]|uniref:hypothetical protein n=1 Tax=Coleofasciculus sp. D1-CHI-01 TaxID=3068482 RepID=UPI0032F5EAC7